MGKAERRCTLEEVLVDDTPVFLGNDHAGRFRLFGRLLLQFRFVQRTIG